jgi:hypothetical protein
MKNTLALSVLLAFAMAFGASAHAFSYYMRAGQVFEEGLYGSALGLQGTEESKVVTLKQAVRIQAKTICEGRAFVRVGLWNVEGSNNDVLVSAKFKCR